MGELTYSQSFGCLNEGEYHNWVKLIFQGIKSYPWVQIFLHFGIPSLRTWFSPRELIEARVKANANAIRTVNERIGKKNLDAKDFMSYILRHNDHRGMTHGEIEQTAIILMIAGSETTATFLSGCLYLLLNKPRTYHRLVGEVLSTFSSYEEIDIVKTNQVKYLPAVVSEAFRYYPPQPTALPRIVPGAGDFVEGHWVPGDTTVGISQWAANHDPANFYEPDQFLPERYLAPDEHMADDLDASYFANDCKQVVQPFSFGPRNCIGKK